MEQRDLLLTLAEISAAFVGFSTIVVVFRSSGTDLQRLRLRGVAEIGTAVLVGAFLPLFAAGFGMTGPSIWRVSSLLFAPAALFGWIAWARGVHRAGHPFSFGSGPVGPDVVANVFGQALLWWNVISPSDAAPARYVVALMAFLLIAAMSFVSSAFGGASSASRS